MSSIVLSLTLLVRGFLCLETLTDAEMEVAYYTIVTLTHLVRRTGSDEVAMFSQLASLVLQRMEALAQETFCKKLEMKLIPHLELIMTRAARGMSDGFSVRVQELSISLIGAAATAVKGGIVPFMPGVMTRLEVYLTMTHNDDTQVLLTQSMDTLGCLARAVGKEHFNKEFAEKCFNIGTELVKTNDDPDIRLRCRARYVCGDNGSCEEVPPCTSYPASLRVDTNPVGQSDECLSSVSRFWISYLACSHADRY